MRSTSTGDSSRRDINDASDMAEKDSEIVLAAEMDEEEQRLAAELLEEERTGRKHILRAKIAAAKARNAALEAGDTPPSEKPSGAAGGQPPPPGLGPGLGPDKESKFAIVKYLPKLEKIRLATFEELLFGALEWAIHHEMSWDSLKPYLQHLSYMCHMHMPGIYPPEASVDYDLAIREKADGMGMAAFGPGDSNVTMLHYGMKNTYEGRRLAQGPGAGSSAPAAGKKKASHPPQTSKPPPTGPDNGCLLWNHEASCPKGNRCRYPHICRLCGGDHKAPKCTNKK